MMPDVALLAQLEGLNPLNSAAPVAKSDGLVFNDLLLIIGACLFLAFVLFAATRLYFRNRNRRHPQHGRQSRPVVSRDLDHADADGAGDDRGRHRHRRRRRRVRDHRPRNPTLAETGGLPPEKSPPPAPPAP